MIIRETAIGKGVLRYSSIHRQADKSNIFIFSTPRSGSTWTKELFSSQRGMKFVNEPLNIRTASISDYLRTSDWRDLYADPVNPKVLEYFDSLESGHRDTSFVNTFPFKDNYRFVTDRIVYKILHGLEDRIEEISQRYNGHIVYLMRHPIAVSLSRKACPRLQAFLDSPFRRHFTDHQIAYSQDLINNGDQVSRMVLSWCLQNFVPLRAPNKDWLFLTYEQLTLDPEPVLEKACDVLRLEDKQGLIARLDKASDSTNKSDEETRKVLAGAGGDSQKNYLVQKWSQKIDKTKERELMGILEVFEIDAYEFGSFLPNKRFWFE